MSDSVRPHRRQPTRLPHPWDSPGKNAGVGCHFLLHRMKVKSESEVAQSSPTLSDLMDCSLPGSSIHGIFQARVLEWGATAFSTDFHEAFPIPPTPKHPLPSPNSYCIYTEYCSLVLGYLMEKTKISPSESRPLLFLTCVRHMLKLGDTKMTETNPCLARASSFDKHVNSYNP